ncbi:MAG: family 78 glycoside hydrolase catalytic domain, partial [Prevotella sp.]|nr:family 78 glycoside hydrolase catalytic domain [Prevotella sp.]
GDRINDYDFTPLWSDYDKSVFYNKYDLSDRDFRKKTRIEVLLGNGFYNEQGGRYTKLKISFGPPTLKLRLHLIYIDGTEDDIVTDKTWQWSPSELTFNSLYGGEDYDARIGRTWKAVVIQEGPKGVLRERMAPPVKVMERFAPKSVKYLSAEERASAVKLTKHELPEGTFVLDMGQNLAGVPEISVLGKAGQEVRLYVSETLTPEGACNQRQTGRQHYYSYTLKGSKESENYRPRFSYYGFRYIQVEGAVMDGEPNPQGLPVIKQINSCFVYNSARKISTFECSNPLVNKTHELIDRAVRSNMQSVFTDCPHREKLGWLEQDWLNGIGLFMNYDLTGFARQTMRNIADAQHANGAIPTTAPEYVVFQGPGMDAFAESPEWGGTFIMMPWMYKQYYDDDSLLKEYYDQMLAYVNYLSTIDSCGILNQGLGDWYDYG